MAREREEIDDDYKWNLEALYSSDSEWEKEFEETADQLERIDEFEGQVAETPAKLLELLELREELKRSLDDLKSYAAKRYHEDMRNDKYQAMKSRAEALSSELSSRLSFMRPEIQKAGEEKIKSFMQEEDELKSYSHFFDDVLRFRPHTRSKEVETVLANLGDVLNAPDNVYQALMNADMTFPEVEKPSGEKVEITQGNFTNLLKNSNREFRRKVHENFYSEIEEVSNTVSSSFEKNIRRNVKLADIRNYDSARKASLFSNNIPTDVYDNLLNVLEENLDVLHRHLELKKEVLGLEELEPHDVYMPITESESPEISYEEAKEHVLEAVKPLGQEYASRAREGLESGWIDVYENRGKRSGAYSSATYDSQPYILMNYQDDVSSMYTLAHELGHSMHSHYTSESQPYIYSGYGIFVAEVASTVNEALLTRHLLENAESDRLKRHALNHYLENFRNTLFRQTMFADFEKKVHEKVENGEALTASAATEIYAGLKDRYHAPVKLDSHINREWKRIPHFYYNFYVYQYATGISAAETLVEKITSEGPGDYLDFLKSGASDYPLHVLREAGVDMEESTPVEKAVESYRKNIEEAENLVN